MLKLTHISTYDELLSIREEWLNVESKSSNFSISSSYDWVRCWWESFSNDNNNQLGYEKLIYIILIRHNEELVGVIPLMRIHRTKMGFKFSSLEFLGQQWSGVQFDAILCEGLKLNLSLVLKYIYSSIKFDIFYLRAYDENSLFYGVSSRYFTVVPQIRLSEYTCFDDYVKKNYSKRHRQNLRTGTNRSIKDGSSLCSYLSEINEAELNDMIRLSKSKLEDDKSCLYYQQSKKEFYTKLFKNYVSNVIFISVNDVNVAYRANIIFKGLKLCLDASYDRKAPSYELGIKSVDANIKDSFDKNLILHSMGPGFDPYKKKFTKLGHKLFYTLRPGNQLLSCVVYYVFKKFLK